MIEIRGPDPLYKIEVEMDAENFGIVTRTLTNAFPDSVALKNVTDTHVTVFTRDNAMLYEVHQLYQNGKINKYSVP
jgi:hypothetical protein